LVEGIVEESAERIWGRNA